MTLVAGLGRRLNGLAYSISAANRDRKWRHLLSTYPPQPAWKVVDVGFAPGSNQTTENYFEKHYPHPNQITALTINDVGDAPERYPDIDIVRYDGDRIPYEDRTFDLVWSNAVVEHVGDLARQVEFLAELDRVANRHFVTTPNRWFLFEVHTKLPLVHYLPKPLFDQIARRFGKGWATGDYMHLMSRRQFEAALRAAGVENYTLRANRWLGMPIDFVATW